MAEYDGLSPGQVLADASVAEFIKSLGLGIAEAQKALDENSVDQIAEFIEPREGLGGKTLLDMGLSPAFYHYQYADVTCSLQLSLRVEKNLSLGLNINGSYNNTTTESGSDATSSSSSESGTSTQTSSREANVEITSASMGALSVGGQQFQLTGNTPIDRITNLQDTLTGDANSGVARVLFELQSSALNITTDATPEKVNVTSNSVAFLAGGFDSAIVRIGTDVDTDYTLDDVPAVITAATTAKGSLAAYATHVKTQVEAQGYNTTLAAPNDVLMKFAVFNTGKQTIRPARQQAVSAALLHLALAMKAMNFSILIEGFADRQRYASVRSDEFNRKLGDKRANTIMKVLLDYGVPESLMDITDSSGDAAAEREDGSGDPDNQEYRKVEIKTPGRSHYWLFVHSREGGPNLNTVVPNKIGDSSADNGFIYVYKPSALSLSGKKTTIESVDFPFSGESVGGFSSGSPEAYAKNLADDINGNSSAGLKASVAVNVVTVTKDGDKFKLTLITAERRQISLSGSSGVTVTEQFSRSRSSNMTRQNTGNRAVAVGASLDVRYSRQFEMNVSGNSSISARLVSIPAPPQFLESIRNYLKQDGEG